MERKRLRTEKKEEDLKSPEVRAKYAYLEAYVSIVGNSLLFVFKLFLGILINSIGLITDSFHTLSDSASSIVIIFGFKAAKKVPDEEHPFGHGRFEYITTLVIAVLLFIAASQFIWQSIERIRDMVEIASEDYVLFIGFAVILTALVKEAMARFSIRLGKKIDSPALMADAWHHRTDALSSVAVGIGIIGSYYGASILDPIFGIVVSILIIYTAFTLFKLSSDTLVGRSPDKDTVDNIKNAAGTVDGVCGVHEITIHDYGAQKVVSLHVEVECDITAEKAHTIARNVEDRITDLTSSSTIVHVDPDKEPRINAKEVEIAVEEILKDNKAVLFYHKVKITSAGDESQIDMHIVVDSQMPVSMSHNLTHHIKELLHKKFPNCKVSTHMEPCNGECKKCPGICKKE
jgi:cation diffusion facilitator family transporter